MDDDEIKRIITAELARNIVELATNQLYDAEMTDEAVEVLFRNGSDVPTKLQYIQNKLGLRIEAKAEKYIKAFLTAVYLHEQSFTVFPISPRPLQPFTKTVFEQGYDLTDSEAVLSMAPYFTEVIVGAYGDYLKMLGGKGLALIRDLQSGGEEWRSKAIERLGKLSNGVITPERNRYGDSGPKSKEFIFDQYPLMKTFVMSDIEPNKAYTEKTRVKITDQFRNFLEFYPNQSPRWKACMAALQWANSIFVYVHQDFWYNYFYFKLGFWVARENVPIDIIWPDRFANLLSALQTPCSQTGYGFGERTFQDCISYLRNWTADLLETIPIEFHTSDPISDADIQHLILTTSTIDTRLKYIQKRLYKRLGYNVPLNATFFRILLRLIRLLDQGHSHIPGGIPAPSDDNEEMDDDLADETIVNLKLLVKKLQDDGEYRQLNTLKKYFDWTKMLEEKHDGSTPARKSTPLAIGTAPMQSESTPYSSAVSEIDARPSPATTDIRSTPARSIPAGPTPLQQTPLQMIRSALSQSRVASEIDDISSSRSTQSSTASTPSAAPTSDLVAKFRSTSNHECKPAAKKGTHKDDDGSVQQGRGVAPMPVAAKLEHNSAPQSLGAISNPGITSDERMIIWDLISCSAYEEPPKYIRQTLTPADAEHILYHNTSLDKRLQYMEERFGFETRDPDIPLLVFKLLELYFKEHPDPKYRRISIPENRRISIPSIPPYNPSKADLLQTCYEAMITSDYWGIQRILYKYYQLVMPVAANPGITSDERMIMEDVITSSAEREMPKFIRQILTSEDATHILYANTPLKTRLEYMEKRFGFKTRDPVIPLLVFKLLELYFKEHPDPKSRRISIPENRRISIPDNPYTDKADLLQHCSEKMIDADVIDKRILYKYYQLVHESGEALGLGELFTTPISSSNGQSLGAMRSGVALPKPVVAGSERSVLDASSESSDDDDNFKTAKSHISVVSEDHSIQLSLPRQSSSASQPAARRQPPNGAETSFDGASGRLDTRNGKPSAPSLMRVPPPPAERKQLEEKSPLRRNESILDQPLVFVEADHPRQQPPLPHLTQFIHHVTTCVQLVPIITNWLQIQQDISQDDLNLIWKWKYHHQRPNEITAEMKKIGQFMDLFHAFLVFWGVPNDAARKHIAQQYPDQVVIFNAPNMTLQAFCFQKGVGVSATWNLDAIAPDESKDVATQLRFKVWNEFNGKVIVSSLSYLQKFCNWQNITNDQLANYYLNEDERRRHLTPDQRRAKAFYFQARYLTVSEMDLLRLILQLETQWDPDRARQIWHRMRAGTESKDAERLEVEALCRHPDFIQYLRKKYKTKFPEANVHQMTRAQLCEHWGFQTYNVPIQVTDIEAPAEFRDKRTGWLQLYNNTNEAGLNRWLMKHYGVSLQEMQGWNPPNAKQPKHSGQDQTLQNAEHWLHYKWFLGTSQGDCRRMPEQQCHVTDGCQQNSDQQCENQDTSVLSLLNRLMERLCAPMVPLGRADLLLVTSLEKILDQMYIETSVKPPSKSPGFSGHCQNIQTMWHALRNYIKSYELSRLVTSYDLNKFIRNEYINRIMQAIDAKWKDKWNQKTLTIPWNLDVTKVGSADMALVRGVIRIIYYLHVSNVWSIIL